MSFCFVLHSVAVKEVLLPEKHSYKQFQAQACESQPPIKHLGSVEETTLEAFSDEEWDPPTEFADMLTEVTELLNKSADVGNLKCFLGLLCHPRTNQRYFDIKLYDHCRTPREIIMALVPEYVNYMHIHLLRRIVRKFGNEKSKTLLKEYEDTIPHKKPLKRMRDPLSDEEVETCIGTKVIKVVYDGDANVDTTTMEDVEKVQQSIERRTEIDRIVIVYVKQSPGSVTFSFLIPETMVSVFINLDEDSQRELADQGILRILVNDIVIDMQSKASTMTDTSQAETKTNTSTYTSGMKRIPLTHDSPKATHCNSEFQQLISKVETSVAESVEASKLKEFLQGFSHILYPEALYIDSRFLKDAESVPQIFTALQPLVLNFVNWGVLRKVVDAFDITVESALQSYTSRFLPHTKLSTLPDPLSEEEISGFKGFQKLRVTRGGSSRIEWTLGDVQAVREAVEKATGIDQDFIIYAYWEGGFTTHQFTFLIPESISGIFGELCEEDLAILAGKDVQRLEVDYDTVADNIQELFKELPLAETPAIREGNRTRTKDFGLQHFIPEDEMEQMSKEEFTRLNTLITSTPAGKLQETCSNDFLKVFAKKMGSWKDLAPYLGINQWDLEDLAEMYPRDEEEQKYVALITWKSIDVNSATYERLVECLLTHGHVGDAKELLLHFQGQYRHLCDHLYFN